MSRVVLYAGLAAGLLVGCGEEADEADREPLTATAALLKTNDAEQIVGERHDIDSLIDCGWAA